MFHSLLHSYDLEEMKEYVLHLLVLSHVFVVPHLKTESEAQLENDLFSLETVIDVFQLSLLCDASRLAVICHRMTSDNFKDVSSTEGWRVMKEAHRVLERQILEVVGDANAVSIFIIIIYQVPVTRYVH